MNKLRSFFLLITLTFFISMSVQASKVALVIGNSHYKEAPLTNPVNDANDIATKLRNLNFDVILIKDANKKEIRQAVRLFDQKLRKSGDVGLFYYAGHGMQVDGVNYLIPLNASIQQSYDVSEESVSANYILKAMESAGNKLNIVILDACRNNPFARGWRSTTANGILARMDAPTGSIIAYATGPGDTAEDGDDSNGTYTKHLLKNMDTPGLSIEEVFKRVRIGVINETGKRQVPWETNSLTGNFYFIDNVTIVAPTTKIPNTTVIPNNNEEITYWNSIKDSSNPSYFTAYINKYGKAGQFTSIARIKVDELSFVKQKPEPAYIPPPKIPVQQPVYNTNTGDLYASLALDGNQGQRWGYAYDYSNVYDADQQALNECGAGCTVVKNFANGCGAYAADQAVGGTAWGWGTAYSEQLAKDTAISYCKQYGGTECIIRVWACNSR